MESPAVNMSGAFILHIVTAVPASFCDRLFSWCHIAHETLLCLIASLFSNMFCPKWNFRLLLTQLIYFLFFVQIEKAQFSCPPWFPVGAKSLIHRILDPNPEHVRICFVEQDFFLNVKVVLRHCLWLVLEFWTQILNMLELCFILF